MYVGNEWSDMNIVLESGDGGNSCPLGFYTSDSSTC